VFNYSLKNKIPERGGAGFARAPSLWNFIFKLTIFESRLALPACSLKNWDFINPQIP